MTRKHGINSDNIRHLRVSGQSKRRRLPLIRSLLDLAMGGLHFTSQRNTNERNPLSLVTVQLLKVVSNSQWLHLFMILSASQVHPGQFAAGFVDGSVRLFDICAPELLLCRTQPHPLKVETVVGIGFQPDLI